MGAWIETLLLYGRDNVYFVAPHVGAWIETYHTYCHYATSASLPTWERGLKQDYPEIQDVLYVAPHVGAWIETEESSDIRKSAVGRSPRGSVD